MRLLVVIPSFYPAINYGGPIFTSYYTCNELAKLNVQFKVITTNANGATKLAIESNKFTNLNGYPIKYFNETIIGRFSWSLFCKIKADISSVDLVHIQGLFSTPTPIALFWASRYKKTILLTPHGTFGSWSLSQKTFQKRVWLKFLVAPYLKQIIWHATADQEKRDIIKYYPNARVEVIPNGTYLKEFSSAERFSRDVFVEKFSNSKIDATHIIISMGRLHEVKGFDILLRSFSILLQTYPEAMLFIAGDDDGELSNLQKIIVELKLHQRVILTGILNGQEKVDFYTNADLFVLPSHTENFGVVYVEAMAAGTPIVASTNTPWQEVESVGCGRWVPNSIENTANAMLDLLSRDREQLRKNAIEYVQKFDWSSIALQFKHLYEKIV